MKKGDNVKILSKTFLNLVLIALFFASFITVYLNAVTRQAIVFRDANIYTLLYPNLIYFLSLAVVFYLFFLRKKKCSSILLVCLILATAILALSSIPVPNAGIFRDFLLTIHFSPDLRLIFMGVNFVVYSILLIQEMEQKYGKQRSQHETS